MASALKALLLATAAAAVGLSLTNAAYADLVLVGGSPEPAFLDLGAQGGAVPRLLTLRTSGLESGSITPVDIPANSEGADKSSTPAGPVFSPAAPINFKAPELGLQRGTAKAVFDFALPEQRDLNSILAMSGTSGLPTLGCATDVSTTCDPSDAGPDTLLGFARSAVATPFSGAIFLFGAVLFGGLGMSTRRARRRNRGAVSLLA